MSKRVIQITLAAAVVLLLAAPAWAQLTSVKGTVTDVGGPLAGVKVEFYNSENGHKLTLTTDKKGEYFSLGVPPGVYKVTLSKDGQTLWTQENVHMELNEEGNEFSFDLTKMRAAAMSQAGGQQVSAEQLKKIEEAQRKAHEERVTVAALNEKLAAAKAAEDANNWDQAVGILNEATAMDATRHELWASLCSAELGAKKYEDAGTHCQKAVTLLQQQANPDPTKLAGYHNNLGQAYAKSGKPQEAVAEYNTAAQIDPTNATMYYFNAGAVLTNSNHTDEAITAFDKVIAADPTYADAYYWKATNLINKAKVEKDPKTGKEQMVAPPGTAEAYQKYLELKPDGPYAQTCKDVLGMIGSEVQTTYKKSKAKGK